MGERLGGDRPSEALADGTVLASEIPGETLNEPSGEAFVADWSDDLAQIAIELKRLNWDAQQERDYLQRSFQKTCLDDITDHRELMDYLAYLQALPTGFAPEDDDDDSPIAAAGLSVDEADLMPQSIDELMASAGLRPASEMVNSAAMVEQALEIPAPAEPEPVPELAPELAPELVPEFAPEPAPEPASESAPEAALDEPIAFAPSPIAPDRSLSRTEMMDETARLCRLLGWKTARAATFSRPPTARPPAKI
ncbi:MAG: hypothetical protein HC824_16350 [Synechococcales cyanobacterium RM1_1_8]|nr:hypothetical protein [Synechococcales cyanobacterium RM1_1_8]